MLLSDCKGNKYFANKAQIIGKNVRLHENITKLRVQEYQVIVHQASMEG